jgi:hypothetical protein
MNKALSIVLAAAIAAGAVPFARSIEAPSPPPGISTNNWIPMGDAAGFVITTLGNDLKGHFMARREGAWFRVDSSPDYETHPAECPNTRSNPLYGI